VRRWLAVPIAAGVTAALLVAVPVVGDSTKAPGVGGPAAPAAASNDPADKDPVREGNFAPLPQANIADTRDGTGGIPVRKLGPGQTIDIQVTGRGGVPTANVEAVALDLWTTNSTARSSLQAWPSGTPRPVTLMHSAMPGEDLSNIAFVKPGTNGKISLYNDSGETDVLVAVSGYFTTDETGAGFSAVNQKRVADTRDGTGVPAGKLAAGGGKVTMSLAAAGVPATAGAAAVTLVPLATARGGVRAGIPGTAAASKIPGAYEAGQNAVTKIVPIRNGQLEVSNEGGAPIDLVVDVMGYFGAANAGGGFSPLTSQRLYDSRQDSQGKLAGGSYRAIDVLGRGSVPRHRVAAVMLAATALNATADGGLRVDADGLTANAATNLTYEPNQARSNSLLVSTELPATGKVVVFNYGSQPVDVILDVEGWFDPYFDPDAGNRFPAGPGERDFSTFTTAALTDRLSAQANAVNGNLLVSAGEVNIAGRGTDLALGRHYNSRTDAGANNATEAGRTSTPTTEVGAFGPGWTMDATGDVKLPAAGPNRVFHGPTGTELTFTPKSGGGWNTPTGMTATLKDVTGGFELRMDRASETWKFATDGRLTSMVDRNGNTTTYTTDSGGRLTKITDTRGRDLTFTWGTATGSTAVVVTRIADVTGRQWNYGYAGGRLTSTTDPANQTTRYTYDGAGRLATVTDPRGVLATMAYDTHGRVTKLERPLTGTTGGPTTTFAYADGRTRVVDARGGTTTYVYDYLGRISDVWDALEHDQSTSYDANSNVVAYTPTTGQATGRGVTNTYSADGRNNLTRSQSPTGAATTFEFNAGTNPWAPSKATDANGASTTYTYDAKGNQASAEDSAADKGTTRVDRNPDGQVSVGYDANGTATRYSYNPRGELTGIDHPAPLGDESFTYDALSRLATATDGKGAVTTYTYDALDRVTAQQVTGGPTTSFTYDSAGNRTREVDPTGDDFSTFDRHNRVTVETRAVGGEQRYAYDDVGNLIRLTSSTPGASTGSPLTWTHEYDQANRSVASTDPAGNRVTYAYNDDNQRTGTAFPGGTVQTTSYDTAGRTIRIRATTGATVHTDLTYTYGLGANDTTQVQTRTDAVGIGAPAGTKTTYTYDAKNRLIKADERTATGAAHAAWDYSYDKNGNRTSQTLAGSTGPAATPGQTTYTYNAADQLTALNGNTAGFAYDGAGNETSGGPARPGVPARTNQHNGANQVTSTTTAGVTDTFTYSGYLNDQRVRASGTTFTQSALGMIGTSTTSGTTSYVTRDPAGALVSTTTGGTTQYFLTDNLGSVIALVDGTGTRTATYSYDPYGVSRTTAGIAAGANPYRYTGGYLDTASGLYKLGVRYYDPSIARFTQADPTHQEANKYAYALSDPANHTDVTGAAVPIILGVAALALRLTLMTSRLRGVTTAGVRRARLSGKVYESRGAAERAARRYAGKHKSCEYRGVCSSGDHVHTDRQVGGGQVHTRHYYWDE